MSFLRWAFVTVPVIVLLGFAAGGSIGTGANNAWYRALAKPALTPPGWVFPVAWTILYVLIGLALAMILHARGARGRSVAVGLFVAQFALNLAWNPLFFGGHQVIGALILTGAMLVLALATTVAFGRIRAAAAWLMVPYLVWICFAGALTYGIHQLNPNAETLVRSSGSTQIML
ncbi:tryptophan-rich sensory protein [Sphingomonas koreensis]|nr:tryptophan-rich sensory protein [Sphingomonas koreensis]